MLKKRSATLLFYSPFCGHEWVQVGSRLVSYVVTRSSRMEHKGVALGLAPKLARISGVPEIGTIFWSAGVLSGRGVFATSKRHGFHLTSVLCCWLFRRVALTDVCWCIRWMCRRFWKWRCEAEKKQVTSSSAIVSGALVKSFRAQTSIRNRRGKYLSSREDENVVNVMRIGHGICLEAIITQENENWWSTWKGIIWWM